MTAAEPDAAMLSRMAECAYRIGMAFGAEAERAADNDARIKWWQPFDRCFFAVRVSIALQLRLKQPPKEAREAASDRETLIAREDLSDRDGSDLRYTERDRDREVERASFPILIRALDGVAADAAALPKPPPELPALHDLLARAKSRPAAVTPPKPAPVLRDRLTASGAAVGPAPRSRPASNVGEVLALRRATGPPRR